MNLNNRYADGMRHERLAQFGLLDFCGNMLDFQTVGVGELSRFFFSKLDFLGNAVFPHSIARCMQSMKAMCPLCWRMLTVPGCGYAS